MASAAETTPLVIGVIVFEEVMLLDYVGPTSYLELLPTIGVPVNFVTISQKQGPLRAKKGTGETNTGVPLYSTTAYEDFTGEIDILLIPGGLGRLQVVKDTAFLAFIKQAATRAKYVLTVCTGSAILATTGFLDGKNATTNKLSFDSIVSAHPNVNWVRKARWVVDGNIWTSSGVSAGMDMAHAFIIDKYGPEAAANMAKYLETVPNTDPSNDPFA